MTHWLWAKTWLDDRRGLLWWLVAYLAVVVLISALSLVFGMRPPARGGFPGSD